jgi:hypothetical protein
MRGESLPPLPPSRQLSERSEGPHNGQNTEYGDNGDGEDPEDPEHLQDPEQGSGFNFDGLSRRQQNNQAPRRLEISGDLNASNIVTSKRVRKPSARALSTLIRCLATAMINAPAALSAQHPPESTTAKQARLHPYAPQWIKAEEAEYAAHDENGTWTVVPDPPVRGLPTKWVYRYKFSDDGSVERLKARRVVCGNRQDLQWLVETFAAVARTTTLKILLALVAALDLECEQGDLVTAFLNGILDDDEVFYIRLPDSTTARLNKALYGLRRFPRLWYQELACFLKTISFEPLTADLCVFKNAEGLLILAYVDDIVFITTTPARMKILKQAIYAQYKCRDLGPINTYLGMRICRDRPRRVLEISMEPYIDKLVADYNRGSALNRDTPLEPSVLQLKPLEGEADPEALLRYQRVIGKLLYPATQLRADIAFHVGFLARSLSKPTNNHYVYTLQIINYLKATKALILKFQTTPRDELSIDMFATSGTSHHLNLHGYSDASFADASDRKSTSGYLFKLAVGAICHKSVK